MLGSPAMLDAASKPTPAPRSRLKLLVLGAVLLALACVAGAEGLARVFVPYTPPTYAQHPYASHVWSPNLSLSYRTRRGEGELMTLETDAFGFRGKRLKTLEKPAGTVRVFFVGASVIAGVDYTEADSIPGLVESGLDERLGAGVHVECANAALSGVGIQHSFSTFSHLVLPFEPDYLVLYEGINDELDAVDPRFDPTHYGQRITTPQPLANWFNAHLRLMQLSARIRMSQGANPFTQRNPNDVDRPITEWPKLDLEPGFKDWRRYLSMIEAVAKATGVKLVIVTQGCLWQDPMPDAERKLLRYAFRFGDRITVPELVKNHRRYMEEVKAFARAGGHILVDAEPLLPKDAAHFIDDFHPTLESNKILAKAIADGIANDRKR